MIALQSVLVFRVTNYRLYRCSTLQHFLQSTTQLSTATDIHTNSFRMVLTSSIAFVYIDFLHLHSGQTLYLLDRWLERRSIIGIAAFGIYPNDPIAFVSRHYPDFATKLIALVGFPFTDTFHLTGV